VGVLRALLVIAAFAACGGSSSAKGDAPPSGCTTDTQCAAPTPTCDPTTQTCVQCRFSSQCSGDTRICEASTCRIPHSCAELGSELPGLASGVYMVDFGTTTTMPVYCETSVGGGWTLVQRTRWSWAASMPLLTNYAGWANNTIGAPDPGGGYRMAGTLWPGLAARGDVQLLLRIHTTAGGACNPLHYVGTGGVLTVDVASSAAHFANVTQTAPIINGPDLSTSNSGPFPTCETTGNGVPWFYNACCATCPTYQGGYWTDSPHPMASFTATADALGQTEANACSGQTIQMDQAGSMFRGIDTMEVYLR